MRPTYLFSLHQKKRMSFRKDVLLDMLLDCPCGVVDLMDSAYKMGIASPATLHKDIHELVASGLVKGNVSLEDKRIVRLTVAAPGKKYLRSLQ